MPPPVKIPKTRLFVLDAGHGGYDYGIVVQDLKEKDLSLVIANDLSAALSKKGNKVFLTRRSDQSVSITDRINFATSKKPDIFISLHFSPSGRFILYTAAPSDPSADAPAKLFSLSSTQSRYIDKSRTLSRAMGESLKNEFKADILLRELPLPALSYLDAPSVFIECPITKNFTYDQKMRDRFVGAIIKGLAAYDQ